MATEEQIRAEVRRILEKADLKVMTSRRVRAEVGERLSISDMKPHRQLVEKEVEDFLEGIKAGPLPKETPLKAEKEADKSSETPVGEKRKAEDEGERGPATKARPTPGQTEFELSSKRKVSINTFRGKNLVDIREFYEKDGELKPGAKGLALPLQQWSKVSANMNQASEAIQQKDTSYSLDIGGSRKLTVNEFKGRIMVNLREFYDKDGELCPGKKGIALSNAEWQKLSEVSSAIDRAMPDNTHPDDLPAPKAPNSEAASEAAGPSKAEEAPSEAAGPSKIQEEPLEAAERPDYVSLSQNRRASVSEFKGAKLFNLREYYEKDGEMRPAKKGISLSKAQAEKLRTHVNELSDALDAKELFSVGLGNRRYAKVDAFKGSYGVDVRECYEKDGKELPGSKGLRMASEQWEILTQQIDWLVDSM